MTITELMTGKTLDPTFTGVMASDDWVLAIDTTPEAAEATKDEDFCVFQEGVTGTPISLNPETKERNFIRTGKSTTKTGTGFSASIAGTHYIGDKAQDYIMGAGVLFGEGAEVVTKFIHFNIKTGKGIKGNCTITVDSFAQGSAGEDSTFSATLSQSAGKPAVWEYSAV